MGSSIYLHPKYFTLQRVHSSYIAGPNKCLEGDRVVSSLYLRLVRDPFLYEAEAASSQYLVISHFPRFLQGFELGSKSFPC